MGHITRHNRTREWEKSSRGTQCNLLIRFREIGAQYKFLREDERRLLETTITHVFCVTG